jgi:hypothetical protein
MVKQREIFFQVVGGEAATAASGVTAATSPKGNPK